MVEPELQVAGEQEEAEEQCPGLASCRCSEDGDNRPFQQEARRKVPLSCVQRGRVEGETVDLRRDAKPKDLAVLSGRSRNRGRLCGGTCRIHTDDCSDE